MSPNPKTIIFETSMLFARFTFWFTCVFWVRIYCGYFGLAHFLICRWTCTCRPQRFPNWFCQGRWQELIPQVKTELRTPHRDAHGDPWTPTETKCPQRFTEMPTDMEMPTEVEIPHVISASPPPTKKNKLLVIQDLRHLCFPEGAHFSLIVFSG